MFSFHDDRKHFRASERQEEMGGSSPLFLITHRWLWSNGKTTRILYYRLFNCDFEPCANNASPPESPWQKVVPSTHYHLIPIVLVTLTLHQSTSPQVYHRTNFSVYRRQVETKWVRHKEISFWRPRILRSHCHWSWFVELTYVSVTIEPYQYRMNLILSSLLLIRHFSSMFPCTLEFLFWVASSSCTK